MVRVIFYGEKKTLITIKDLQMKTDFGRELADIVNKHTHRPVGSHLLTVLIPVLTVLIPAYMNPETRIMVQVTFPNKFPTKEEDLTEDGRIRFLQELDVLFSKYFSGKFEHIHMASIELQPVDPSIYILKNVS